ncbi:MAG TPA: aldo/keto reductase [Stellaceae bacterium]|jgi:aryl-alcohol dehydrogenase-like predicted oxidoreductase|nr:aldo/keto reductase [Stellaceae bacterium]
MDYVSLAPGLPASSRLGFGCASVMGRVAKSESLRAIAAALDHGITHFDVARLYGYGEAEALLGTALRGRRDKVVVASKFGLAPPRAAGALRRLKPLARSLIAAVPALRGVMHSAVGSTVRAAGRFSVGAAEASLDQSLAALATDYLDILFLHDCGPDDLTDELTAFLDAQIAAGKIRAYGVATSIETVAALRQRHDGLLCQFANSVCVRNAETLPGGMRRFIAHSPFSGADRVGVAKPHRLMLGWALAQENVAVVLCSMLDEAHLRANLDVAERPDFTDSDLAALAAAAP